MKIHDFEKLFLRRIAEKIQQEYDNLCMDSRNYPMYESDHAHVAEEATNKIVVI